MSIPNHILDQLNSQADLVGMISKYTTLKRSGGTYRGKCPFHKGDSNSFSLNPQKNIYHCFKCSASGNAFSFLKDYENLTFIEAVEELSRQTGIEVPKEDNKNLLYKRKSVTPTHHNTNNRSNKQPSNPATNNQSVNNSSTHSSQNQSQISHSTSPNSTQQSNHNYDSPKNSISYENAGYESMGYENLSPPADWHTQYDDYFNDSSYYTHGTDFVTNSAQDMSSDLGLSQQPLQQTTITEEDGNLYDLLVNISKFYQKNLHDHKLAIAYFKDRGLTDATIEEFSLGYAPAGWQHLEQAFPKDIEGLKALGLVRKSEKGRDYDLLRDRVIFPIKDNQGRIIGFAGRALDNDVQPKYINSSESPVFHKQYVLYGYYESRLKRATDWLVVEGYMDVIALYQAGIYGAVASMGTAINESQIARLLQMNPTLTLSFDGDSAGQKAAWRTLEVALPVLSDDKELRFLTLPGNHDPDTYIATHGVAAMQEQIKQAVPLSQYIYAYLSDRYDLSVAEGKAKLMSKVRELTNNLPKGSSFKYLLNNDIYQKLGGRNKQKNVAHDVLLDFDSDMTVSLQLELCLMFAPRVLAEDPIKHLWHESGVTNIQLPQGLRQDDINPSMRQQKYEVPTLPTWKNFNSTSLTQLIEVITTLMPHIPKDTNAAAHFILANLPITTQQTLSKRWYPFWSNLNERGIIEIDELIDDLLIKLMLQALSDQLSENKHNIVIANHINRQRQTFMNWYKKIQAEQATKMN